MQGPRRLRTGGRPPEDPFTLDERSTINPLKQPQLTQGELSGYDPLKKLLVSPDIMSLQINERSDGDVTILELKGRILMDCGLFEKVSDLVTEGKTKVLLNVAEVSYVDSAGLGEVVRCLTTLLRNGGRLKLLSPSKRIRHLLSITELIKMFEIFDNEKEAVGSY